MTPETLSPLLLPALLLLAGTLARQEPPVAAEVARLAPFAGEWDAQVSFPGAPPIAGRAHIRLLEHGSWAVEDFEAEMQGMPFRGHGLFGWDGKAGRYSSVWVDNMEGKLTLGNGAWDEKAGAFVLHADVDFGEGPQRMRETWRFEGRDAYTFTMEPDQAGAPAAMSIRYTRRK